MSKVTRTASRNTGPVTNGAARRKCQSWIDEFVASTENLATPVLFRKWAAISCLAAVCEQKVWLTTSAPIYPNLYVILIGHPGSGKTRALRRARQYLHEIPEFHFAPTSVRFPSLIDALARSKRLIIRLPDAPLEYNSVMIAVDEFGAFMHQYDKEMTDGLSMLYEPDPYSQERRHNDLKIKIERPQVNIACGCTPSNLMDTMPESAWGQGFSSRIILVYSEERIVNDDFEEVTTGLNGNLIHDLKHINSLVSEFKVTADYRNLVNLWRQNGEEPAPSHPKLIHYNTRRRVHLYKLSMLSAIDRSDVALLTRDDFNRAMNWLVEVETFMPDIFAGRISNDADGAAMEEAYFYVKNAAGPKGLSEHLLVKFLGERVPAYNVMRVIEIMEKSRYIRVSGMDVKTQMRTFTALPRG